jgi:hypothetical protein
MIRRMTRKKKTTRYDANAAVVIPIYERATQGGSADYLTVNQKSDAATVNKVLAEAVERRERRNARRLRWAQRAGLV